MCTCRQGATPKDGPSAGITLATSITSALLGIPVRNDVAMTGEISLRGRVLPIGGLREKLLAARRSGIRCVIMPRDNEKDLKEVPDEVLKDLEIIFVEHVDEVLPHALDASRTPSFPAKARRSPIYLSAARRRHEARKRRQAPARAVRHKPSLCFFGEGNLLWTKRFPSPNPSLPKKPYLSQTQIIAAWPGVA